MFTFLPDPWCKTSQMNRSGSQSRSTVRLSRLMYTRHTFAQAISSPQAIEIGRSCSAVVVLIGIWLGTEGANPIYYESIKVCDPVHLFHMCSIDVNEGTVYIPAISGDSGRTCVIFILLCWFSGRQSVLFGPPSYTRDNPLRPPTQTNEREREHGISIRQAMPERGSGHLPVIIIPRCPPLPVALVYPHYHTQLLRRHPYQNNCQQSAPPEVHTFIGTPPALMEGRYCRARLAMPAWTLPRCTT
jgi:hypothetical protein